MSAGLFIDILEGILLAIPSKKQRQINKKMRRLGQEEWFKSIIHTHGKLLVFNQTVRDFIYQIDLEKILKDTNKRDEFQSELKQLLVRQNL